MFGRSTVMLAPAVTVASLNHREHYRLIENQYHLISQR